MSRKILKLPAKTRPISDSATLYWERYFKPTQAAAAAMNAAVLNMHNIVGERILEMEGVSKETHFFDADRMVIVEKPK